MNIVSIFSGIGLFLVWPLTTYLGVLALLARRPRQPNYSEQAFLPKFVVVVPAHNEEQQIATTVQGLLAIDYPAALFRVAVVADNCTDATAQRARQAGAEVIERHHVEERGKGFALAYAFEKLLEQTWDAVVVVDADTLVAPNLLRAFAFHLMNGAKVVQTEYGVANPDAAWRTRLMAIALGMFHAVRSLGRERLRLSCGLRGNGMCFSREILQTHPHKAHGLAEDVEYGVLLGLSGVRVHFAYDSWVKGEMVTGATASVSQRRRWEAGRVELIKTLVPKLARQFFLKPDRVVFDLMADLLVPPLSYIGLLWLVGLSLESYRILTFGKLDALGVGWLTATYGLAWYVLRGVEHSGLGLAGLRTLLYAPWYVLWKIVVAPPWLRPSSWKRTQRESESTMDKAPRSR